MGATGASAAEVDDGRGGQALAYVTGVLVAVFHWLVGGVIVLVSLSILGKLALLAVWEMRSRKRVE